VLPSPTAKISNFSRNALHEFQEDRLENTFATKTTLPKHGNRNTKLSEHRTCHSYDGSDIYIARESRPQNLSTVRGSRSALFGRTSILVLSCDQNMLIGGTGGSVFLRWSPITMSPHCHAIVSIRSYLWVRRSWDVEGKDFNLEGPASVCKSPSLLRQE
jgi:hypothetical protein